MGKTIRNKPPTPRFNDDILRKGGRHEKTHSAKRKQVKQKLRENHDDV